MRCKVTFFYVKNGSEGCEKKKKVYLCTLKIGILYVYSLTFNGLLGS